MRQSKNVLTPSGRKLRKQGFSLVEVMVAVGILGVLTVAVVSQLKLSYQQSTSTLADGEINNVTNQVLTSIGIPSICAENFGGHPIANNYAQLVSGGAPIIQVGSAIGISANEIRVSRIETVDVNPASTDEMLLRLTFQKKKGGLGEFFAGSITREIRIGVSLDGGNIASCSTSYDLLIKTIIQQSCQGNSAHYDPTIDPLNYPYGRCVHAVKTTPLTPAKCSQAAEFLTTVSLGVAGDIQYPSTCARVANNCTGSTSPGQVMTDFDTDGNPVCSELVPVCGFKQVLIRDGAGQLRCSADLDCSSSIPRAFTGFDASGSPICTPLTNTAGCPSGQYTVGIDASGNITCSTPTLVAGGCNAGEAVSGISATGTVVCKKYMQLPFNCPALQGLIGFDSSGNRICQPLERPLACDGTKSAHKYSDCVPAGGTIYGAETNDSHCVFTHASTYNPTSSTCPIGWTPCRSFTRQLANSCVDSSNTYYCNSYTGSLTVAPGGGGVYGDFAIATGSCKSWTGASGNGKSCAMGILPAIKAYHDQTGCY